MTKRYISFLGLLFFIALTIPISKAQQTPWPKVEKESKPWTRWWWMGNAVDENNIKALLQKYNEAGIGGVEIAPIYGAKDYEDKYISHLSPRWMDILHYTVREADNVGMKVDLTAGTGWPYGGPQVGINEAATKAIFRKFQINGGERLTEKVLPEDPREQSAVLQSLSVYDEKGKVILLQDKVKEDGTLDWVAPKNGKWELYAVFAGKTRQMVKRAAPGGEGFTVNHYSKSALNHYLNRFDEAFASKNPRIRAFYNDSFEVYGADWSEDFYEEFQKRRGYDLRLHIKDFLSENGSEDQARLKSDYRQTVSEMLLNNFTRPLTKWAHQYQSLTKSQAHGSPGNLIDLYAAVDIPEVETFGSSYFPIPGLKRDSADVRNVDPDPIMLKFASSAAHVTGKKLVSSETFTWLTEHFKTSLSQCKPEVEQCFISGVNHVFYHGVTYSPEEVEWPGWLFYASVNFVPTNSFWPHLSGLNSYITRVQSVLQTGKPDNELLLYWPVFDSWDDTKGQMMSFTVHNIDQWLHPTKFYKNVKKLQDTGYSFDFVSDDLLTGAEVKDGLIHTSPNNTPYKTVVVPVTRKMPTETLQKLIQLANQGTTLIFQALPEDVPGLGNYKKRSKHFKKMLASIKFFNVEEGIQQANVGTGRILISEDVVNALVYSKIEGEQLTENGLGFIRRQADDGLYYYLVNHNAHDIDAVVPFQNPHTGVVIMDPQSGDFGKASLSRIDGKNQVRVQLKAGEAAIFKFTNERIADIANWKYLNQEQETIVLDGKWSLEFKEGGPELPEKRELDYLAPWTESADKKSQVFSGTGVYTTEIFISDLNGGEFILDLGEVNESARVLINGMDVGISWSIPHRLRINGLLKSGENTIQIEVTNLMANRIRDMDRKGIEWRRYHEINFVNIDYQEFDASYWKVQPSGLKGPVKIIRYSSN